MTPGLWQILILAVIVLFLFGSGRLSHILGDLGKGVKNFKKGLSEDDRESQNETVKPKAISKPKKKTATKKTTATKKSAPKKKAATKKKTTKKTVTKKAAPKKKATAKKKA